MVHESLVLAAAIIGGVGAMYLLTWYPVLIRIKSPENHRRLWQAWFAGHERVATEISEREHVSVSVIRLALVMRVVAVVVAATSALIFGVGLLITR